MTKWARPVLALYDELLTWRHVADACDGPSERPRGSYYLRIAKGRIRRPGVATRRGIAAAYKKHCCSDVTAGYGALGRTRRFPMVVEMPLGGAINQWRIRHRLTWNQWSPKAHELMRREYREGDEE